jgi:hypothetical protein
MTTTFGATSTTDDVLTGADLRGKRILVTGVSAGLGVQTARALTAHGAHIVGAARNLVKLKRRLCRCRKTLMPMRGCLNWLSSILPT